MAKKIIRFNPSKKLKEFIHPIVEDHQILEDKLKLANQKVDEVIEEIDAKDRKGFRKLILEQVKMYHFNPLLEEMEEYQNKGFNENISFELNIPSGKIVISHDMDDLFPLSKEIATRERAWRMIMHPERTLHYANLNTAYVQLAQICPRTIVNSQGGVLFACLPYADDEGMDDNDRFDYELYDKKSLTDEESLTGYIPRSGAMHIADYDEWVKAGGDKDELLSGEEVWEADDYDPVVLEITAGRYLFTSYASNDEFWKGAEKRFSRSRVSVAKMELIESY